MVVVLTQKYSPAGSSLHLYTMLSELAIPIHGYIKAEAELIHKDWLIFPAKINPSIRTLCAFAGRPPHGSSGTVFSTLGQLWRNAAFRNLHGIQMATRRYWIIGARHYSNPVWLNRFYFLESIKPDLS